MPDATQLKKGNIINYKGSLWVITDTLHVTKGNLRGFVRLTIRNMLTGQTLDEKFSSSDNVEIAYTEYKDLEFSYKDSDNYVFVDPNTYDQTLLPISMVSQDDAKWLSEGQTYKIIFYENKPMMFELSNSIDIDVVETEPFIKGQTAARSYKPAKLANGATVNVPPFISNGDRIKVNPNTLEYVERVTKQ